ncbi:MAG TPA: tRNA preQ1(34) S-adenosylmethionine ribosyltransferase-isomerase QueA [Pyrinomonadaceae bacterium]|nr:tRNA preQ1(34) S-adenosylmethionine ribosyltransferase-isomerase QueA [Pyrinomonadaceae bacterium]
MNISEFDYELPEDLIAQEPLSERDASRMLVVDRERRTWDDSQFAAFPNYIRENDVVVINNTRVFPARLMGKRDPSGGRVEVLLVRELEPFIWETLLRPGHRLRQGDWITFGDARLRGQVLDDPGNGMRWLRFECQEDWQDVLNELGAAPLPPYIRRAAQLEDRERYQTIFAREAGAIAAPTAGLHFTPRIFEEVRSRGGSVVQITLHVGYGTFEPVRVEHIEQHRVALEQFEITHEAAATINHARSHGGRVIAIGTTTTRALEAAADARGRLEPVRKNAGLTIIPGYRFRITDILLTNFHLPRSSLLLLVSAFGGRNLVLDAYHHAVKNRYRFYSYGDCMLLI